jgi:hypothetical protein
MFANCGGKLFWKLKTGSKMNARWIFCLELSDVLESFSEMAAWLKKSDELDLGWPRAGIFQYFHRFPRPSCLIIDFTKYAFAVYLTGNRAYGIG